jgi:hypothetical protein
MTMAMWMGWTKTCASTRQEDAIYRMNDNLHPHGVDTEQPTKGGQQ